MAVKTWLSKLRAAFKRRSPSVVINISVNGFAAGGYMSAEHLEEVRRQTVAGVRDALRAINGR